MAGQLSDIQAQMEDVDLGLNPLGLAKGVVPFDINPLLVTPPFGQGQTHFEQVYDRALEALRNAVDVWDFANNLTQRLHSTPGPGPPASPPRTPAPVRDGEYPAEGPPTAPPP